MARDKCAVSEEVLRGLNSLLAHVPPEGASAGAGVRRGIRFLFFLQKHRRLILADNVVFTNSDFQTYVLNVAYTKFGFLTLYYRCSLHEIQIFKFIVFRTGRKGREMWMRM